MARPERNNVDYFPHEVGYGKKMHYIESKYKNNGYAVWYKMLEELGKADYHYLDISDEVTVMFISSSFNVSEIVLKEIITDLVKLDVFDKYLYDNGIIYSQKFVDSIEDAYSKRNNTIINKNSLLELLISKGRLLESKSTPKQSNLPLKGVRNTQSIEEDTKEDNINIPFELFWDLYDKKVDDKESVKLKWNKLKKEEQEKAINHIPNYIKANPDKKFRKNPSTYLNQKTFNGEVVGLPTTQLALPIQQPKQETEWWRTKYPNRFKTYEEFDEAYQQGIIDPFTD